MTTLEHEDWQAQVHRQLVLQKEIGRIDSTFEEVIVAIVRAELQAAREEGYEERMRYGKAMEASAKRAGYAEGFAAEQKRILTLLTSFPDSPVIQQVIELMHEK